MWMNKWLSWKFSCRCESFFIIPWHLFYDFSNYSYEFEIWMLRRCYSNSNPFIMLFSCDVMKRSIFDLNLKIPLEINIFETVRFVGQPSLEHIKKWARSDDLDWATSLWFGRGLRELALIKINSPSSPCFEQKRILKTLIFERTRLT